METLLFDISWKAKAKKNCASRHPRDSRWLAMARPHVDVPARPAPILQWIDFAHHIPYACCEPRTLQGTADLHMDFSSSPRFLLTSVDCVKTVVGKKSKKQLEGPALASEKNAILAAILSTSACGSPFQRLPQSTGEQDHVNDKSSTWKLGNTLRSAFLASPVSTSKQLFSCTGLPNKGVRQLMKGALCRRAPIILACLQSTQKQVKVAKNQGVAIGDSL